MRMSRLFAALLILCFALPALAADPPAKDPVSGAPGSKELVGSPTDWKIYLMETLKYAKIREMVRNAYIEVQTWKALKANWERQKEWFDRNRRRWQRIKENLHSAATEGNIFQRMRRLEDASNETDEFFVVETENWNDIMATYEDNSSQMWDVAGSMMGNRLIPASEIWARFDMMCRKYSLGDPSDPGDIGVTPPSVEDIFTLPEWKRRRLLGKSLSVVAGQHNGLQMQRKIREDFWSKFNPQISTVNQTAQDGNEPKADAIYAEDLLRRTQTLADINDLIRQRTMETQLLLSLAGDEEYKFTSRIANLARGASETKKMRRFIAP